MKLRALAEMLNEMVEELDANDDPADPDVILATQQNYPFENSVVGICRRSDYVEPDEVCEGCEGSKVGKDGKKCEFCKGTGMVYVSSTKTDSWSNGGEHDDVIIVEGSQLRYGSKAPWEHARRS